VCAVLSLTNLTEQRKQLFGEKPMTFFFFYRVSAPVPVVKAASSDVYVAMAVGSSTQYVQPLIGSQVQLY
jgi:hypothetical protein